MPYLQVDLDALEEFEVAGTLAGTGAAPFAFGCLRLWRDCWRQKAEHVTPERLLAFFPGAEERKLVVAMTSCGFLEASGAQYRVRGAEKRLGIRKAQQDAGKKHLKNLRQYQQPEPETLPESTSGLPPGLPGTQPEVEPGPTRAPTSGSAPALTANSQQPTANIEKKKKPSSSPGPAGLVTAQKPDTPRETWGFAEFERWVQYTRQRAGLVPENTLPSFELERWWAVVTEWTGGDVEPVCAAFIKFGASKHWETANPPFPLRAFLARWKDFMPAKEVRHAHG